MYALPDGTLVSASYTDQAGRKGADSTSRTHHGVPCEACGDSYTVQRKYQKPVIAAAQSRAAQRYLASVETLESRHGPAIRVAFGFKADAYLGIVADFVRDAGDDAMADRIMALASAYA